MPVILTDVGTESLVMNHSLEEEEREREDITERNEGEPDHLLFSINLESDTCEGRKQSITHRKRGTDYD